MDKRIHVVVGHYGSGKTEFSVNYAIKLHEQGKKVAIIDLDIANPYFRSRERQGLLESMGIAVYSNAFDKDITQDLPALAPGIRAPLEDESYEVVVDVGGNDSGARVLIQYGKYIGESAEVLCVINGNRPETRSLEGALAHIEAIENETQLKATGIINNTHMLRQTSPEDIKNGFELCTKLSKKLEIPIKFNCLMEDVNRDNIEFDTFPIKLYMRESWLDR